MTYRLNGIYLSTNLQFHVHFSQKLSGLEKVFGSPRRYVIEDLPRDEFEHAHNVPFLLRILRTRQHVLHALQGSLLVFKWLLHVVEKNLHWKCYFMQNIMNYYLSLRIKNPVKTQTATNRHCQSSLRKEQYHVILCVVELVLLGVLPVRHLQNVSVLA